VGRQTTRTVLRDDGTVVIVTEDGLVLVDPNTGQANVTHRKASAITTDGTYAVNITAHPAQNNSTTVDSPHRTVQGSRTASGRRKSAVHGSRSRPD
jgi:hypothetical protein